MNKTDFLNDALSYVNTDLITDAFLYEKEKRSISFEGFPIAAAVILAVAIPAAALVAPVIARNLSSSSSETSTDRTGAASETESPDITDITEDGYTSSGRYFSKPENCAGYIQQSHAPYVIDMETKERIFACGDENCDHKQNTASCIFKDHVYTGAVTNTDRYIFFTAKSLIEKTHAIYKYDMKTKTTEKVVGLSYDAGVAYLECYGRMLYYGNFNMSVITRYDLLTERSEKVYEASKFPTDSADSFPEYRFVCPDVYSNEIIYMKNNFKDYYITVNGKYDLSKKLEFADGSYFNGVISGHIVIMKTPAMVYDYKTKTLKNLPINGYARGVMFSDGLICFGSVPDNSLFPQFADGKDTDKPFYMDFYTMKDSGYFTHYRITSDIYGFPCAYYEGKVLYEIQYEYKNGKIYNVNECDDTYALVDLYSGNTVLYNDKYDVEQITGLNKTVTETSSFVEIITEEDPVYPQFVKDIETNDPDVFYRITKVNGTSYAKTLYICGIQTYSVSVSGDPDNFSNPSVVFSKEDISTAKNLIPKIAEEYKDQTNTAYPVFDRVYRVFDKEDGEVGLYEIWEYMPPSTELSKILYRIKTNIVTKEVTETTEVLRTGQ